jgi:hypothetical protein
MAETWVVVTEGKVTARPRYRVESFSSRSRRGAIEKRERAQQKLTPHWGSTLW